MLFFSPLFLIILGINFNFNSIKEKIQSWPKETPKIMVVCLNFFKKKICHIAKISDPQKKREIEKIEHNFNFEEEKRSQAKFHRQKERKRMDEEGNG